MTNETHIDLQAIVELNKRAVPEIKNGEDLKKAVEILSSLNRGLDTLVEDRERITKPMMESLKEVRARYKPAEEALKARIKEVRGEMTRYQTQAVEARIDAEEGITRRVGEGRGKLRMDTAITRIEELETVDKVVDSGDGAVSFRTVKKFEVMDMTMLPIEYHVADETAIRKALKEGIELPGVRYYEEQNVWNKR